MLKNRLLPTVVALILCLGMLPVTAFAEDDVEVEKVWVSPHQISLTVGGTHQLRGSVSPTDADDTTVSWETRDYRVAQVDANGLVRGMGPGSTRIYAYSKNGKSDVCIVTVAGAAGVVNDTLLPSGIMTSTEGVTVAEMMALVNNAVVSESNVASVILPGRSSVAIGALQAAAEAANKAGKTVILKFTTGDGAGNIQGQLNINAASAAHISQSMRTSIYTEDDMVKSVYNKFTSEMGKPVRVIYCGQQGSYGLQVDIYAKMDMGQMDTSNLMVYSYDAASNTHARLDNATCQIDTNGYMHITTETGGYLILTEK